MPGAIEATREGRTCRTDGNEARAAPHIVTVRGRACRAEAAAQRVAGGLVHCHQLQLVRGIDGVRPFRRQHGARAGARAIDGTIAADDHPVVARRTGRVSEIETCEITALQHLRAGQAQRIRGGRVASHADGGDPAIQALVEIGIRHRAAVVIADDHADADATRRELARVIDVRHCRKVVADDTAHGGIGSHIAGGVAVAYRAI